MWVYILKQKKIIASIGPYGPYLKHDNKFLSLKEDDVTIIGINRAVELIAKKASEEKEVIVGEHPETKSKILRKKELKGDQTIYHITKKITPIPPELSEKTLLYQML